MAQRDGFEQRPCLSMMDQAAQQWASELTRVGDDFSHVVHRLQVLFGNASEQAVANGGESLPDPVKLLRRLAALETRMERLRSDCLDVADRRGDIVVKASQAQLANVERLHQLSAAVQRASNERGDQEMVDVSEESQDWNRLASVVASQYDLFASEEPSL